MDIITKISAVAAISASAWAAFKALEETASPIAKASLTAWLKSTKLDADRVPTLHDVMFRTFRSFYGNRIFSKKFLLRSLITSFIGAIAMYLLMGTFVFAVLTLFFEFPNIAIEMSKAWSEEANKTGKLMAFFQVAVLSFRFFVFIVMVVIVCWLVDYLSLVKSWLLLRIAKANGAWKRAYAIDLLMTLLISMGWALFWAIGGFFGRKILGGHKLEYNPVYYSFNALLTTWAPTFLIGSFIFLSSIAKLLRHLLIPFEFIKSKILNLDEMPFQSVGILSAIVLAPITTIAVLFFG